MPGVGWYRAAISRGGRAHCDRLDLVDVPVGLGALVFILPVAFKRFPSSVDSTMITAGCLILTWGFRKVARRLKRKLHRRPAAHDFRIIGTVPLLVTNSVIPHPVSARKVGDCRLCAAVHQQLESSWLTR